MKISNTLKITLIALLLGVGFAACGNKNNDKSQSAEKKLVKMTTEHVGNNFNARMYKTFSYHTDGRLMEITTSSILHSGDTVTHTYKYVWNTNSIDVTEELSFSSIPTPEARQLKYTMNLSDGLARSLTYEEYPSDNITYNYDASNRLQHTSDGYTNIYNEWDNDKLISITRKSERRDYITTFTYGEYRPIKGYLPLVPNEIVSNPLFVAHPELGGMKTGHIYVSKTIAFSDKPDLTDNISQFEYEFDKDGYISKITSPDKTDGNDSTQTVFTFIWE